MQLQYMIKVFHNTLIEATPLNNVAIKGRGREKVCHSLSFTVHVNVCVFVCVSMCEAQQKPDNKDSLESSVLDGACNITLKE